ncbi:MAG: DUF952 domain-containing protein [Myxococcales bacterium]|nr:DUF952 domain-containing protein [Myxococcales bacterium]
MRWLYHLVRREEQPRFSSGVGREYRPASLESEGFVHCSYKEAVAASAALYFAGERPLVLRIDPRRLSARVEEAPTPRGPMPHVHGPIPLEAIVEVLILGALAEAPDAIRDEPGLEPEPVS